MLCLIFIIVLILSVTKVARVAGFKRQEGGLAILSRGPCFFCIMVSIFVVSKLAGFMEYRLCRYKKLQR